MPDISHVAPPVEGARHRIVIVGGGAGGLELATRLGDRFKKSGEAEVVLVDQSPTHLWKPLLHEVAAGSLDRSASQLEYAAQARWHHFQFQQGALIGLQRERKQITVAQVNDETGAVILPERVLAYDTLVLAIGSVTNFFNTPGASQNALSLDSVTEAEHFRRKLIATCMRAQHLRENTDASSPAVDIAIIGAGATGVELAAELRNTAQVLGAYGLHRLDPQHDIHITLIEAGSRILGPLPERVAQETARMLEALHITTLVGEPVTDVQPDKVVTASGKLINADIIVWTAGIRIAPILANVGLPVNKLGQVIVSQHLQLEDDASIFAFGDCANCPWPESGKTVPPRAQAAHQQASYLFDAIPRRIQNKSSEAFHYHDHGSLISLGRFNAVGNLMGKITHRSLLIEGALARLIYFSLYRAHLVALHGVLRMMLDTVAHWLRRKTRPRVKLH